MLVSAGFASGNFSKAKRGTLTTQKSMAGSKQAGVFFVMSFATSSRV